MTSTKDIRWHQRLNNFKKALSQLKKFIDKGDNLNELEEQGMIQAFEYSYELVWKTLKDFYEYQGESSIQGSKDAFKLAYERGVITDQDLWRRMLEDRNRTVHSYNEETADEIAAAILSEYYPAYEILATKLGEIAQGQLNLFNGGDK